MKTPAVVCGIYRKQVPTRKPRAVTTRCTSSVMSTICVRRLVFTRIACIAALRESGDGNNDMTAELSGTGQFLQLIQTAGAPTGKEWKETKIARLQAFLWEQA